MLLTKIANGKAIGQPLRFHHPITKDLETKHGIRKVLADSLEHCSADEIVLDNIYYVKKKKTIQSELSVSHYKSQRNGAGIC